MINYKLDIMGLSEIRWKDSGKIKTQNGNFLIFSGVGEDKEHRIGVCRHSSEQRSLKKLNGMVTNFRKDNISVI